MKKVKRYIPKVLLLLLINISIYLYIITNDSKLEISSLEKEITYYNNILLETKKNQVLLMKYNTTYETEKKYLDMISNLQAQKASIEDKNKDLETKISKLK